MSEHKEVKPKVNILFLVSCVVVIAVSALLVWWKVAARPLKAASQTITIDPGTGRLEVAKLLKEKQLIRSEIYFIFRVTLSGRSIQAGTYTLNPANGTDSIITTIAHGRQDRITVLIPEGWRKEQIANQLSKKGLDGAGFLTLAQEKEGYLFPDTYYFPPQSTAQDILDKFLANFDKRTADLGLSRDKLIVASIVEREAKRDAERPIIAAVFLNRIKLVMKLDADPTVQYGRDTNLVNAGTPPEVYWRSITLADYSKVISPYNTYLHTGLPPSPIANPGLKSIQAALSPNSTKALYFFHTPSGDIITSSTLEEHIQNKQKYLK